MSELSKSDRWALAFFFATAALAFAALAFPNMSRAITIPGAIICFVFALRFAWPDIQVWIGWIRRLSFIQNRNFIPIGLLLITAIGFPVSVNLFAHSAAELRPVTIVSQPSSINPNTPSDLPSIILDYNFVTRQLDKFASHGISNIDIENNYEDIPLSGFRVTMAFSSPIKGFYSLAASYMDKILGDMPIYLGKIEEQNSDYVIFLVDPISFLNIGLRGGSTETVMRIKIVVSQ